MSPAQKAIRDAVRFVLLMFLIGAAFILLHLLAVVPALVLGWS